MDFGSRCWVFFFSVRVLDRAQLDAVIKIVNDAIAAAGFECIEAEWLGNVNTLRLFVERPGHGIDLSGCVEVNSLLYNFAPLDAAISGDYHLEVSSPGVERPLRTRQHFERYLGEVAEVKLWEQQSDRKAGTGRIVAVDSSVTLETSRGLWVFDLAKLQKAHLVYDWESGKDNRNAKRKD